MNLLAVEMPDHPPLCDLPTSVVYKVTVRTEACGDRLKNGHTEQQFACDVHPSDMRLGIVFVMTPDPRAIYDAFGQATVVAVERLGTACVLPHRPMLQAAAVTP